MATPRDIRRLAFQGLFHLDAAEFSDAPDTAGTVREVVEAILEERAKGWRARDFEKAAALAQAAFDARRDADALFVKLAPTWPTHRMPAVDRTILRLAYAEMQAENAPPRVIINEAVELAKRFSTERSPAFVNGMLDKAMRALGLTPAADVPKPSAQDETNEPAALNTAPDRSEG